MVAKKKTGTLTSSFLPKRALVLLIVMCALVTAFFVLPKNQNSLSSTVLPPPTTDVPATTEPSPTTSEPLSTTNCPDANITLEWTANESTTNASTNPVGYKLSYSSATGSNGSVSISGRTTTTATVTLTAAPDPGVNYTFSITAVNAEGIESIPSTPVKETITCDENGKIIITPTPTSNHLACNSSGDCAFVDGAGSNECEAVKTKDPECASDPYVTPPPYNPFPEGVPRHNMCDYYEKECKPVSGA